MHVYLTDAGRALKDVLVPLAEEVNASGAKGLTADEIAVARRVLLTMITNLAEDATGGNRRKRSIRLWLKCPSLMGLTRETTEKSTCFVFRLTPLCDWGYREKLIDSVARRNACLQMG